MRRVLSLFAEDRAVLQRAFSRAAGCFDAVELRLDRCSADRAAAAVREAPCPVIATVMPASQGGGFVGPLEERIAILTAAARAGAQYIDLDCETAQEWPRWHAHMGTSVRLLVSVHDREPQAPRDVLAELRALSQRFPQYALKRVFHVRDVSECAAIVDAVRQVAAQHAAPLIVFSMGAAGHSSRVLAAACGSAWTYLASSDAAATAPGQWTLQEWNETLPAAGWSEGLRIFGIVGSAVAHSLSPAVHNAWFRARGEAAAYLRFETDDARRFFEAFEHVAGGALMHGYSVTQPFKEAAWQWAHRSSPRADAMRAANTLVRRAGVWYAENTDGPAVCNVLERAGARLRGARALILGAGGAARAAAVALRTAGADVCLALRRPEAAAAFACAAAIEVCAWEDRAHHSADILINATPLGSSSAPAQTPYESAWIAPDSHVLDMLYRPRRTALLSAAERAGAIAIEGLEMFLEQARYQSELFCGVAAPLEFLRHAADAALRAAGEA